MSARKAPRSPDRDEMHETRNHTAANRFAMMTMERSALRMAVGMAVGMADPESLVEEG